METILIVDVDPERADLICGMLCDAEISAKRCHNIDETRNAIESTPRPAVIVAHCQLVNYAFTELARLRHHPNVKLIFYCTNSEERSGSIVQLPQDLKEIILRITDSGRNLFSGAA